MFFGDKMYEWEERRKEDMGKKVYRNYIRGEIERYCGMYSLMMVVFVMGMILGGVIVNSV